MSGQHDYAYHSRTATLISEMVLGHHGIILSSLCCAGIGPYADHSDCVPSHICELGRPKCCPMPQTVAGRNAGAAAASAKPKPKTKPKRKASAAPVQAPTGLPPASEGGNDARLTRAASKRQKVELPNGLTNEPADTQGRLINDRQLAAGVTASLERGSSKRGSSKRGAKQPAGATLSRNSSARTRSSKR